jgi:diguanylate cyclase (GGDEF)-like protein
VQGLAVTVEGTSISVTISAGCANLSATPDGSAKSLLQCADQRLYSAKRNGRNRVVAS